VFIISADEQRENPTAVMDALKVFDKKVRDQTGQKYMGARSTEDLTADTDTTTKLPLIKIETPSDANGLPVLPAKSKDEKNKGLSDKQVSTAAGRHKLLQM